MCKLRRVSGQTECCFFLKHVFFNPVKTCIMKCKHRYKLPSIIICAVSVTLLLHYRRFLNVIMPPEIVLGFEHVSSCESCLFLEAGNNITPTKLDLCCSQTPGCNCV